MKSLKILNEHSHSKCSDNMHSDVQIFEHLPGLTHDLIPGL
jgi:hypothetical protein